MHFTFAFPSKESSLILIVDNLNSLLCNIEYLPMHLFLIITSHLKIFIFQCEGFKLFTQATKHFTHAFYVALNI